jgi:RNA polymerase sigma-70 factor (ECF subfamily)
MKLSSLDGELVEAARRGSTEAFSVLVGRHQAAVRGFLRRSCGNWADAEDLAQDTFIAAWSNLDQYGGAASFRAWLCGIAYRKALSHHRSGARRAARDRVFVDGQESAAAAEAGEAVDLARAMAELPLDQRAAVALCLAAGFSHSEAADAMGLPIGTVKSHVLRGRAKLLQALGENDV